MEGQAGGGAQGRAVQEESGSWRSGPFREAEGHEGAQGSEVGEEALWLGAQTGCEPSHSGVSVAGVSGCTWLSCVGPFVSLHSSAVMVIISAFVRRIIILDHSTFDVGSASIGRVRQMLTGYELTPAGQ